MADVIKTHTHVLEDGSVIEHTHVEEHEHEGEQMHGHSHMHDAQHQHGHGHTHQNTKAVLNRLSRAIGHLESIRRMVEDGRDCTEVLIQLSAVKSALNNTGKVILQDHIEHCIVDAVREGDSQALEELNVYSDIKHVIGVVSGKGGVGKSFVTASLANQMAKKGFRVGILDADITGPSIPKMYGLHGPAMADDNGIYPMLAENGIKVMSINLLLPNEEEPVIWRGPIIANMVKHASRQAATCC